MKILYCWAKGGRPPIVGELFNFPEVSLKVLEIQEVIIDDSENATAILVCSIIIPAGSSTELLEALWSGDERFNEIFKRPFGASFDRLTWI